MTATTHYAAAAEDIFAANIDDPDPLADDDFDALPATDPCIDLPPPATPTPADLDAMHDAYVRETCRRDALRVLRGKESGTLNRRAWRWNELGNITAAVWYAEEHARRFAAAVLAERVDPFERVV